MRCSVCERKTRKGQFWIWLWTTLTSREPVCRYCKYEEPMRWVRWRLLVPGGGTWEQAQPFHAVYARCWKATLVCGKPANGEVVALSRWECLPAADAICGMCLRNPRVAAAVRQEVVA